MDEFECEELSGTDESAVIFVCESECEEGEKVSEEEVYGEIRVGVGDEVEP